MRAPERLDQAIVVENLVRMDEQDSEQRPLATSGERYRPTRAEDRQRPEDAEFQLSTRLAPFLEPNVATSGRPA
jgi:hypothetical protein